MFLIQKNSILLIQGVLAIALFICACYIYVGYRTSDMILYTWLHIDFQNMLFELIRSHKLGLPNWMIYNMPDALWLLSYLLLLDLIWIEKSIIKICFLSIVPCFAFGIEIFQFYGLIEGTGDYLDLLSYTFALVVYRFIVKLKHLL